MKKILITGANSYIGTSFEKYMIENHPNEYQIDTLDMKDPNWKNFDFSGYDSVFHVAGIAHADVGDVSEEKKKLYYKINTDLAIETAGYAKINGVKQFIYMSSIIVYGESAPVGKKKVITKDTIPIPLNFYGDSKLQADLGLLPLQSEDFNVVIVRPPMIYGPGSKGNYQTLSRLAKQTPIFPDIKNVRSILFVGNLCVCIKEYIDKKSSGIKFPQNNEYASTSEIVKEIAKANGKKIIITKLLNPCIFIASKVPGKIQKLCNKAFGSFVYDLERNNTLEYMSLYQSIRMTEYFKNISVRQDKDYSISVLMSIYKKDKCNQLEESIKSILKQTLLPNQFIIVIDGPIDISLNNTLQKYKKLYPNVIELLYLKSNKGLGNALNEGIKKCKFEFIARMDSDDISKPNRLEAQITEFKKNPCLDILGSQIDEFVGEKNNIISKRIVPCTNKEIVRFSHRRSPFNHPTVMYRKSVINFFGGYCGYGRKEDLELFVKMVNEGCHAKNSKESLLWYRTSLDNLERRRSWINCKEYIEIMFKFYKKNYISIIDFFYVVIGQIIMYLMPISIVKKLNSVYLRKGEN